MDAVSRSIVRRRLCRYCTRFIKSHLDKHEKTCDFRDSDAQSNSGSDSGAEVGNSDKHTDFRSISNSNMPAADEGVLGNPCASELPLFAFDFLCAFPLFLIVRVKFIVCSTTASHPNSSEQTIKQ
jgi:hypothetical protein